MKKEYFERIKLREKTNPAHTHKENIRLSLGFLRVSFIETNASQS
jgi:hypothetical protein